MNQADSQKDLINYACLAVDGEFKFLGVVADADLMLRRAQYENFRPLI